MVLCLDCSTIVRGKDSLAPEVHWVICPTITIVTPILIQILNYYIHIIQHFISVSSSIQMNCECSPSMAPLTQSFILHLWITINMSLRNYSALDFLNWYDSLIIGLWPQRREPQSILHSQPCLHHSLHHTLGSAVRCWFESLPPNLEINGGLFLS